MENKEYESFFDKKLEEVQNKRAEELKNKKKNKKVKKGKKGWIAAIIALALAGIIALTHFVIPKKKKGTATPTPTPTITAKSNPTPTATPTSVDSLGMEEELSTPEPNNNNSNEYGETTGNVDKDKIVEENDNIWKDKEASDKKDQIGKVETDDKNGTLETKPNGDVYEKEEGYEVKDEEGKVVESGSNESGIPDGYAWDSVLNKLVKEDQVGKYVYVDATYYGPDGTVVFKKGEIVLKETLEKMKKQLTTVKPTSVATPKPTATSTPKPTATSTPKQTVTSTPTPSATPTPTQTTDANGGILNADGTYTIYDVTYMDKATFEAFIMDENSQENFGFYNGIVYPKSVIEEMSQSNQKSK